ncbi:hypothetical protein ACFWP3_20890 [Streptomyces sp. NPDC058525]|uniref:hypothetical protein n=1 Tax=Streptomyces sp. NPDC058525 TaxID=3346538 RepID=UPI003650E98C
MPQDLGWVRHTGLVGEGRSLEWYASWAIPLLAACGFPYAQGPELDLRGDAMAFFFVFDDQFDGPLGQNPARTATVCQQLIDTVHGAALASGPTRARWRSPACGRAV